MKVRLLRTEGLLFMSLGLQAPGFALPSARLLAVRTQVSYSSGSANFGKSSLFSRKFGALFRIRPSINH